MKLSRKMQFWLIEIILAILGVLFLLLGQPKLPGIEAFFDNPFPGKISLALFIILVVLFLIVFVASNYLGIDLLEAKEEEKQGEA